MSRQRAISFARSSGVFCVSPVMMTSPPALDTAEHPALDDGMRDAEHFGDGGLQMIPPGRFGDDCGAARIST
jgi:hypothetical protein